MNISQICALELPLGLLLNMFRVFTQRFCTSEKRGTRPSDPAAAQLQLQPQANMIPTKRNGEGPILAQHTWGAGQGKHGRTSCCRGSGNSREPGNCWGSYLWITFLQQQWVNL